jgi:predicted permease
MTGIPSTPLRLAVRTMRQAPTWAGSVVLTLALGIGLATAVFTIADAVLIHPLPVRAPDRVVVLWGITPDGTTDHFPLLYGDATVYTRSTRALSEVAFFSFGGALPVPIDLGSSVSRLHRSLVSGNYFDVLGTRPALGRTLRAEDDVRGAAPVAVLSYAGWQRFFGGDSTVLGRRMVLHFDGTPYTIVGVMPRGLDYPRGVDFWTPVVPNSGPLGDQPIYAELNVIGRLRSDASATEARLEMTRFFESTKSVSWRVTGVARTLTDDVVGNVGPAVLAFGAAAALLLLITCINVANLLLVRGLARIRELAVRAALGASRARLVAQLLTEGAILAIAGGIAGALLAAGAVKGFIALAPTDTPRLDEIHIGAPMLFGAMAVTTIALLLFALAPSVAASRVDAQTILRATSTRSSGSRGFRRAAQALVVGQIALAMLVLCVAGLVGRTLVSLERIPVAFDPARLLVMELALPKSYMGDAARQRTLMTQLSASISGVRGVRSVAPVYTAPFAPAGGVFGRIPAEGQSKDEEARNPAVDFELATPEYFTTFGIPLLRGRTFTDDDREGSLSVAIVSAALARHYWPSENPIGKRFVRGPNDQLIVVGVVGDTHYRDLRNPRPTMYLPLRQSPFPFSPTTLVIATEGLPAALVPTLKHLVTDAEPGVAVASAMSLDTYLGGALAQPRMNALLLALFAGASLALAAVGLFGVMATSVRLRSHELSIRLALGAAPAELRVAVLRHAFTIVCWGLGTGLVASLATTRALRALLFGVSPTDVPTLGVAGVLLLVVAFVAAYVPAARAERMDPAAALRE